MKINVLGIIISMITIRGGSLEGHTLHRNFGNCAGQQFGKIRKEWLYFQEVDWSIPDLTRLLNFKNLVYSTCAALDECEPKENFNVLMFSTFNNFFTALEKKPYFYRVDSISTFKSLSGCADEKTYLNCSGLRKIFSYLSNTTLWEMMHVYTIMGREALLNCSIILGDSEIRSGYSKEVEKLIKGPKALLDCFRARRIDPLLRPKPLFSKIPVWIYSVPTSLISLTNEGQLSLFSWIRVDWYDPRRIWVDQPEFDKEMLVNPDEFWRPTIWIAQCFGEICEVKPSNTTGLYLKNDGLLYFRQIHRLDVICSMDLALFPFDKQTCSVIFFSTLIDLEFFTTPKYYADEFLNQEWKFENYSINKKHSILRSTEAGILNYSAIEIAITFSRSYNFYVQNVIVPVILLSILSVFSILLKSDSSDKLQVATTILLGFLYMQSIIAELIPKDSPLPYLSDYLIIALIQSAVNIGFVTITMRISIIEKPKFPPSWIVFLVVRLIGLFLFYHVRQTCSFWHKYNSMKLKKLSGSIRCSSGTSDAPDSSEVRAQNCDRRKSNNAENCTQAKVHDSNGKLQETEKIHRKLCSQLGITDNPDVGWLDVARVLDRLFTIGHLTVSLGNFFVILVPVILETEPCISLPWRS